MPLYTFSAEEAVENRKNNPNSVWGDRSAPNRVEPIARPGFQVPFQIPPGEKIFTVGSCFARNVEEELLRRGFDLPMRTRFKQESQVAFLNNYGTPSIYNEFAWAFGEQPYVLEDNIIEAGGARYIDLHMKASSRPEPYDVVLNRRRAVSEAYATVADCPVLIMTLGLAETWFDTRTGFYLNNPPRPANIREEPDRFQLHVLSFDEAYDYLDRAIQVVRKHSRVDLNVLITVSPVPLTSTHREIDVIVANAYSKSVLRTAAETLVARYDFVTYYPSYESVMLSDRQRAWRDDLIHVTHEIVAFNIGRMVDAFIGGGEAEEDVQTAIENGGAAVAAEKAKTMRTGSREKASAFFETFGDFSSRSVDFATEHAGFLFDIGDLDGMLGVLDRMPGDIPEIQAAVLRARALVAAGRAAEAVQILEPISAKTDGPGAKRLRAAEFWDVYLDAAKATNDEAVVEGVLGRLLLARPTTTSRSHRTVGRWFQDRGQLDRAMRHYEMAIGEADVTDIVHVYMAESLTALGRADDAREALAKSRPDRPAVQFHHDRVKAKLGEV